MALYAGFAKQMVQNSLLGINVKAALLGSGYAPARDLLANQFWTDVQSYEVSGAGYPPGGIAVNLEVDLDPTELVVNVSCTAARFGVLTVADVSFIAFYADSGSAATSQLLFVDALDYSYTVDGTEVVYEAPDGELAALVISDET